MNTNCGNFELTLTRNDKITLLTEQSDWWAEAVSGQCHGYKNTFIRSKASDFHPFGPRSYTSAADKISLPDT